MKKTATTKIFILSICLMGLVALLSFKNDRPAAITGDIVTKEFVYLSGKDSLKGYIAYSSSLNGKRPGILVVHEWWGADEYVRNRARMLAQEGYIAFAIDLYGNGVVADNPAEAGRLAGALYNDPVLAKARFESALTQFKTEPLLAEGKIAAIGYCFGGSMVLNMARQGVDLDGVVSFHGNLKGVPVPENTQIKTNILVCHGAADVFISAEEKKGFKDEMAATGADYIFKEYPGATHAFTNPGSTETGKKFNLPIAYNKAADEASWNDMKAFFKQLF